MQVKIRIPTPLQPLTGGKPEVQSSGANVKAALQDLEVRFPGIEGRLYDEKGQLRRFVNIYVNDEDIRFLEGEATSLVDGDELSIVPAIAGGSKSCRVVSHERG